MLFASVSCEETEEIDFSSAFPDVFSMVFYDANTWKDTRDVDTS